MSCPSPLDPVFDWLADQPMLRLTMRDRARIARVLQAEHLWTPDGLETVLAGLLTHHPQQREEFRRSYRRSFELASLPGVRPHPLDRQALLSGLKAAEDAWPGASVNRLSTDSTRCERRKRFMSS